MTLIKVNKDIKPLFDKTIDLLIDRLEKMQEGGVEFDLKVINTAHTIMKDHGVQAIVAPETPQGLLQERLDSVSLEIEESRGNVVPNPFPKRKTTKSIDL
jgi:hypothetical protein